MHTKGLSSLLAAVFLANVVSPALLAGMRPSSSRTLSRRPCLEGIPSKKAVYRGGTVARMLPSTVGTVDVTDLEDFVFRYKTAELRIVYEKVNSLEYGQKAGRRLGLAIAFSPLFLLSKKRRHYITIGFLDAEGRQQAAVFELGKKLVRTTLAGLEARSGVKVVFQDEEARRASQR